MPEYRVAPDTHIAILAGGEGTRLWPLSRSRRPKQLLQLGAGSCLLAMARSSYAIGISEGQLQSDRGASCEFLQFTREAAIHDEDRDRSVPQPQRDDGAQPARSE